MDWKKLMVSAALAGAVVGCGGGPGSDPPVSRTYVVSTIDTDTDDASQAYGFDLDDSNGGIAGQPCTGAADFTSPTTMATGVDNQLSTVLPTLGSMLGPEGANGAIRDQIQMGKLLLVFEVEDINSFNNDSAVQFHVYLGAVPAMGTPMTDGDGLSAGQTFDVAAMGDLGVVSGSISNGRLTSTTPMLPLMFEVSGSMISLVLRNVEFGGRVSATAGSGITGGEFGAVVLVDDVVNLAMMFIMGVTRDTVEALANPDMQPDTATMGMHCNAISAGMGFEAVTATLNDGT